jgi:hypothetical protein
LAATFFIKQLTFQQGGLLPIEGAVCYALTDYGLHRNVSMIGMRNGMIGITVRQMLGMQKAW